MVCFREGRSGSVFLAFDLRELVSGWRGSWVSDALLQKRFQLFDDFWALVIEISGLGKIGFQIVELCWRSVRFESPIFDVAL